MWQLIKSKIFTPVRDFFSGIFGSIRNFFVGNQQRAEREPLIQETDARASSAPVLRALVTHQPSSLSPFDTLPDEILKEISSWLPDQPPPSDKGFVSNSLSSQKKLSPLSECIASAKRFHSLLQPPHLLNKFLQYVVYGNQKKAKAILKTHPELLTQKSTVVDYSGRTIYGTALQIALGAEDVKYHDDEECMAEMLMRYLKQLPNGETFIQQQIAEQFPEGCEEKEKARAERDLVALKKVAAAIENAQDGDHCDADIQAFKKYLDDENKGQGVIKTGKHFNVQLLPDAFNLYMEKFNQFGGRWDSPKNKLFWCKVVGSIRRYVPACYAQALCQGTYHIVEDREILNRKLTLRDNPNVTFFPLDADPKFRLGEDYADCGGGLQVGWAGWVRDSRLQTMSNKKHQRRKDYAAGAKQSVRELTNTSS